MLACAFNDVYINDNVIARTKYGFGFAAGKARDFFLFNSFDQVHNEHSRFHLDAGVFLCNCATTTVTGMCPTKTNVVQPKARSIAPSPSEDELAKPAIIRGNLNF